MLHYTIFRTKWGYFGLAGTEEAITRTCLPVPQREQAEQTLLIRLKLTDDNLMQRQDLQQELQRRITAYYEGEPQDFSLDPAVDLRGSGPFARKVLQACRRIAYGQTMTYSALARKVGHPGAARAVGSIMAGNSIPLIIPCHRVLRTDGGLGGFSAPGGIAVKQRMLSREQASVLDSPRSDRR